MAGTSGKGCPTSISRMRTGASSGMWAAGTSSFLVSVCLSIYLFDLSFQCNACLHVHRYMRKPFEGSNRPGTWLTSRKTLCSSNPPASRVAAGSLRLSNDGQAAIPKSGNVCTSLFQSAGQVEQAMRLKHRGSYPLPCEGALNRRDQLSSNSWYNRRRRPMCIPPRLEEVYRVGDANEYARRTLCRMHQSRLPGPR